MRPKTQKKKLRNNKLKLVYKRGKEGKILSYACIEHSQAERIVKIVKYLTKNPGRHTAIKISKKLKIPDRSIHNTFYMLAGVIEIHKKKDGVWVKIMDGFFNLNKDLHNKKVNIPRVKKFLKSPMYGSLATI